MIQPVRHFVLVRLRDTDAPQSSAIQLVRLERPASTRAEVIAIGEEVRDVRIGMRVVISRMQGIEIGDGMLLLPESAVLATEGEVENSGAGEAGGLLV